MASCIQKKGILFIAALSLSASLRAEKKVIEQNGCVAIIEAHPKQRYDQIYIIEDEQNRTSARVMFRNDTTWQVELDKKCERDWIGTATFGTPEISLPKAERHDSSPSTSSRENQSFSLGLEVGMALVPLPTYGMYGAYFLGGNDLIEFSYVSGALDIILFRLEGTMMTAKYRKYWGNSFNTAVGLGQRTYRASSPFSIEDGATFDEGVQHLVFEWTIGNRWQWRSFHLGCDWLGSLTSLGDPSATFDTEKSGKSDKEDEILTIGQGTTLQLLRLNFGFSF